MTYVGLNQRAVVGLLVVTQREYEHVSALCIYIHTGKDRQPRIRIPHDTNVLQKCSKFDSPSSGIASSWPMKQS